VNPHRLGPSYPGTVVLDIGDRTGALVVYTDAASLGREIDIRGPDGSVTHSAVRERHLAAGTVYCAVYPGLPAGEYAVEGTPVTVAGATVTEARIR
jgi:hypothetical protein